MRKQQEEKWELFFFLHLTLLCVSVETESRESEEYQPGEAESSGGVCAWTCGHGKDQNLGQGNVQPPMRGFLPH